MATTVKQNWKNTWVVQRDGRSACKLSDPSHTVCFDEISADVWMDRMEAHGFTIQDDRGKPEHTAGL